MANTTGNGPAPTRTVRAYLRALEQPLRRSDPDRLATRIDDTATRIANEPRPHVRLELVQRRLDLEQRLHALQQRDQLERDFVAVAATYAERRGITADAWRELGVAERILAEAGLR